MPSCSVVILQDNAFPHVAKVVQEALARIRSQVLSHPAYSPDLSLRDFHLFGPTLKGERFHFDKDVTAVVTKPVNEQSKPCFSGEICSVPKQWDAYLNAFGDFFS